MPYTSVRNVIRLTGLSLEEQVIVETAVNWALSVYERVERMHEKDPDKVFCG